MSDQEINITNDSQNENIKGLLKSSLQSLKEEVASLKEDLENPDYNPFQTTRDSKGQRNSKLSGTSSKKGSLSSKKEQFRPGKRDFVISKPTSIEGSIKSIKKGSYSSKKDDNLSATSTKKNSKSSEKSSLKSAEDKKSDKIKNGSDDGTAKLGSTKSEKEDNAGSLKSIPEENNEGSVGKRASEGSKEENPENSNEKDHNSPESSEKQSRKSSQSDKVIEKEEQATEADVKQIELKGIMKEDVRKGPELGQEGLQSLTNAKQMPLIKGSVVSRASRIAFDPHVKKQEPRQSTGSHTSAYSTYSRAGKLKAGVKNLDGIGPFTAVSVTSYQSWKRTAQRNKMPNTYQLAPLSIFNSHDVKMIMISHIKGQLERMAVYDSKIAIDMALSLSSDIKASVRVEGYDRYKYCVLVTVGEKRMQGVHMDMRCLWDKTTDNYAYHLEEKSTYYVMAVCCGVYRE